MTKGTLTTGLLIAAAALPGPAEATGDEGHTKVYVDCAAAPGGDGSKTAPVPTITAALPIARALAMDGKVTIDVAEGICDDEVFPIELDFPVRVRGSRSPEVDEGDLPVDGQDHDTLVTWVPPSPVPPSVGALAFFRITGSDVRISKLSLDGKIAPGTVTPAPAATAPIGVLAHRAKDFVVDQLRIVRMGNAVRAQGASGRVRDTYVGKVSAGIVLTGGDPTAPPKVICTNNRVEDYWTGAFAVSGAGPAGQSIRAVVEGNDTVTSYANTGPSNPFGVRISPILAGTPFLEGSVRATFEGNQFRGSPRYAIIANGGQTVRRADGQRYTGVVETTFADNLIDEAGITRAASLITFTNSRATELPCELDPANTKAQCPTLMGNPPQYWEYLEAGVFDLRHSGELDGALIDHPEIEPVDGRDLDNLLVINNEVVDHETFVAR
jgi:hypothetical protein